MVQIRYHFLLNLVLHECVANAYLKFPVKIEKESILKQLFIEYTTFNINNINKLQNTTISKYLKNDKQRDNVNSSFSKWETILTGVPQGSILCPLLFNIFLNNIFSVVTYSLSPRQLGGWQYSIALAAI